MDALNGGRPEPPGQQGIQCSRPYPSGFVGAEQTCADGGAVHQHGGLQGKLLGLLRRSSACDLQQVLSQCMRVSPDTRQARRTCQANSAATLILGPPRQFDRASRVVARLVHAGRSTTACVRGQDIYAGTAPTILDASRALGVDPCRRLDQAIAYGCFSAAWNAIGDDEERDMAIAAAMRQCDNRHIGCRAGSAIPTLSSMTGRRS